MNIFDLFADNLKRHGEYESLVFDSRTWTSFEIAAEWDRIASLLSAAGVQKGNRIVVLLPNLPEIHTSFPAIWKVGAVVAPLHYTSSIQETEDLLSAIEPIAIITTNDKAQALQSKLRIAAKRVFVIDYQKGSAFSDFNSPTHVSPVMHQPVSCNKNDAAVLIFTSGSSGKPKGIIQSHGGFVSLVESLKATDHAREAAMMPFHDHISTVTLDFTSYAHTGRMFFLIMGYCRRQKTVLLKKMDISLILKSIEDHGVTFFGGSPVVYEELCSHPRFEKHNLSSVRVWCSFAAPVSEEKLARYERHVGKRIYSIYGLSESIALVATEPGNQPRRPGSVGLPVANTALKIIDDTGNELPRGEAGELCVKREANALGYLGLPGDNAKTFVGEWVHTGDIAKIDADGFVYIVSRKTSMINQGGFKVIPSEVEATLLKLGQIQECAVIGLPDDLLGAVVGAFVQLKTGNSLDETTVIQHCRQHLSENKIPRRVYFVNMFPRTNSGKIDFATLSHQAEQQELERIGELGAIEAGLTGKDLELKVLSLVKEVYSTVLPGHDLPVNETPLSEAGMSSLKAVEFSVLLSRKVGRRLSTTLVFAYPSLDSIVSYIAKGLASSDSEFFRTVAGRTPADLNREVVLDPEIKFATSGVSREPSQRSSTTEMPIFFTGCTGFFGTHVLDELRKQTGSELVCLVRANSPQEGRTRLNSQLRSFGFDPELFEDRLEIVIGDVGSEKLGLGNSVFRDLSNRIGTVYHAAALVNHLYSFDKLKNANVYGTHEILRLCSEGRSKDLVYSSTTAVGVKTEAGNLDHERALSTGYGQSKWVAEKMVKVAEARGLKATIFRAGRLCWNSVSGSAHASQFEILLLKAMIVLGAHPPADMIGQLLPNIASVDYAARAMVHLASQARYSGRTFHLLNPAHTDGARMIAEIKSAGYNLHELSFEKWLAELDRRTNEFNDGSGTRVLGLLMNMGSHSANYKNLGGFDYTCDQTTEALSGSEVQFADPIDAIGRCLKFLVKTGFIPNPT